MNQLIQQYGNSIQTLYYFLILINAILHVIFAGAVAKDGGQLAKVGQRTALVSPYTWAFATLVGGVFIAAMYWFIHHSTFTRPTI